MTPQYMPRGGGLSYFTPVHPGTGPADFWRASMTMGVRAPYFREAGADFTAVPRPFGAPIFAISDSARFVSADLGFEYAAPVQPGTGPALCVRRVDGDGVRLAGDADFASFDPVFGTRSPILARRDLARRVFADSGPLDFEGVRMETPLSKFGIDDLAREDAEPGTPGHEFGARADADALPVDGGVGNERLEDAGAEAEAVFVFADDRADAEAGREGGGDLLGAAGFRMRAASLASARVMTPPRLTLPRAIAMRPRRARFALFPSARRPPEPGPAARVPAAAPALPRALAAASCFAIAFLSSAFFSLLTPLSPLSRAFTSRFFTVGDFGIRRVLLYRRATKIYSNRRRSHPGRSVFFISLTVYSMRSAICIPLPDRGRSIMFAQVFGIVLTSSLVARFVRKYLVAGSGRADAALGGIDYRERGCVSLRLITDRVVLYLRGNPEKVVRCSQMRRIVGAPSFFVGIPAVASLNAVVDFSEKFRVFAKKTIETKCVDGEIKFGDLADALEAETERTCAESPNVSLPKITFASAAPSP